MTVSTERVNVALPDKQSLYHAHLLQNFGPDDMLVYVHRRRLTEESPSPFRLGKKMIMHYRRSIGTSREYHHVDGQNRRGRHPRS